VLVTAGNGIEVASGGRTLFLDPKRATPGAVVTHAHSDHLTPDAHMTPPTLDFLRIRRPTRTGLALAYGRELDLDGVRVRLHDAGHVFGSAMVHVDAPDGSLLYTGDFNPRASLTTGAARPVACDVLVTESTYGDPRFDLPPQGLVLESLEAWMLQRLLRGPVALGAYPLGRAQELAFLANRAGIVPILPPEVAAITAVYNAHGHDLRYAVAGTERASALDEAGTGALHIVPREWLKRDHPFARGHVARGGASAYLSGWCHRYSYFNAFAIDAQFALSDHASHGELVRFALDCHPKRVYTTHGSSAALARELRKHGLKAEAL
jgi:Cft2 family RNA processing exonuclease